VICRTKDVSDRKRCSSKARRTADCALGPVLPVPVYVTAFVFALFINVSKRIIAFGSVFLHICFRYKISILYLQPVFVDGFSRVRSQPTGANGRSYLSRCACRLTRWNRWKTHATHCSFPVARRSMDVVVLNIDMHTHARTHTPCLINLSRHNNDDNSRFTRRVIFERG